MGTTVTPNLGLIKPDTAESIKQVAVPPSDGWALQNSVNCNKIDALFRAASNTISPAFAASGGGLTLGSGGFIQGKTTRVFPRMAVGNFIIDFGAAGLAAGTGFYKYSNIDPSFDPIFTGGNFSNNGGIPVGKAVYYDSSSAATSNVFDCIYDLVNNWIFFRCPDGSLWGASNPVAIGQLDRLSGYIMYPTTDA